MRRESSEQPLGSATVTTRSFPFFVRGPVPLLLALCGVFPPPLSGGSLFVLIEGTGACSATWTGSVGAVLGKDNADGRLFVREVPPGMGAARAGVAIGDEVVAIEGKPVAKLSPAEVHEALSGKVGTKVKITVVRAGVTIEYSVERGPLSGT